MLDPVAVALKFGFLAVLYLFLLWTVALGAARPAPQRGRRRDGAGRGYDDATGLHAAERGPRRRGATPKLRVGDGAPG